MRKKARYRVGDMSFPVVWHCDPSAKGMAKTLRYLEDSEKPIEILYDGTLRDIKRRKDELNNLEQLARAIMLRVSRGGNRKTPRAGV